ncbi:MAG: M20 family metallopeptidase, partial [Pyrinomonadaceae bacterium]
SEELEKCPNLIELKQIERPGYGLHLLARVGSKDADTRVMILGHTDTVYPVGTLHQRPWCEAEGKIYAPGVFDMKANCALAVMVIGLCAESDLLDRREVTLLLTCDEETGSEHGRSLVEEQTGRCKTVFVLEPPATAGAAKTGRKGTANYQLEVKGIAAHAGLDPEKGASAIREISRQINHVYEMSLPAQGTTINVGLVGGGIASNVVAPDAQATIDVRFCSMDDASRIEQQIFALKSFDSRTQLKITGRINRPPLERSEKVLNLYSQARSIAALLDVELGEATVGGASDGNFAAAVGASVLDGLGVDGDGAHAEHEHIVIDRIPFRGALLAGLIAMQ